MYSYHIVAELRQFRGARLAADPRVHRDMPGQRERNAAIPA